MDDANLEAGGGEGALHGPVIPTGAFHRHQAGNCPITLGKCARPPPVKTVSRLR
jgi:hypothetical protein